MLYAVIGLVLICLSVFWVIQFVIFIEMKAEEFETPHDRLIWAAAFCLVFFAAPFAFLIWKMRYEPPEFVEHIKPEQSEVADSVSSPEGM